MDVAVDETGIAAAAPAGTNVTQQSTKMVRTQSTPPILGSLIRTTSPQISYWGANCSLPLKGSLNVEQRAGHVNQTITLASINQGQLRYAPLANENGNNYASFTFQVQDSGLLTNGGVNLDPTPNTFTFNITPVNDAPVMVLAAPM